MNAILERGIWAATEENILVFDNEAKPGIFTKRLIGLIKSVTRRQSPRWRTDRIYLPSSAYADVINWLPPKKLFGEARPIRVQGVDLIFIQELEQEEHYRRLFKKIRGALHYDDLELILATNGQNFMLGSY